MQLPQNAQPGAGATLIGHCGWAQITATLTRGSKVAPEIGPQAVGVSPVLALVNLVPANQNPIATCRDVTAIPADDDVAQPDNRVCGVANNIGGSTDVNSGSLEPDTAEFDTLATITAGSYVRLLPALTPSPLFNAMLVAAAVRVRLCPASTCVT